MILSTHADSCSWFFVACILTASFLMVIDVGPGPFFVFQVLFSVGAWAMVIIAAYLSGLYLSEVGEVGELRWVEWG